MKLALGVPLRVKEPTRPVTDTRRPNPPVEPLAAALANVLLEPLARVHIVRIEDAIVRQLKGSKCLPRFDGDTLAALRNQIDLAHRDLAEPENVQRDEPVLRCRCDFHANTDRRAVGLNRGARHTRTVRGRGRYDKVANYMSALHLH